MLTATMVGPSTNGDTPQGGDALGSFEFNKHVLNHRFCTTCGVSPFVEGPTMVAVNMRCVEGVDLHALPIEQYDGAKL